MGIKSAVIVVRLLGQPRTLHSIVNDFNKKPQVHYSSVFKLNDIVYAKFYILNSSYWIKGRVTRIMGKIMFEIQTDKDATETN